MMLGGMEELLTECDALSIAEVPQEVQEAASPLAPDEEITAKSARVIKALAAVEARVVKELAGITIKVPRVDLFFEGNGEKGCWRVFKGSGMEVFMKKLAFCFAFFFTREPIRLDAEKN